MKRIHVIATSQKRIITVGCPTDIPRLLNKNEDIQGEWYYHNPEGLEEFLHDHADQLDYFLKGFSYWIMSKVKGFPEKSSRYGKLKRTIKEFSESLFKKIRVLSGRIAKEIRKVVKPKRVIYNEQRKQKKNTQKVALYELFYTNKKETSGYEGCLMPYRRLQIHYYIKPFTHHERNNKKRTHLRISIDGNQNSAIQFLLTS